MKPQAFKNKLKEIKESLRGKSISICMHGVSKSYNTLRELGNRILELEQKGYSFSFYQGDYTRIEVETGINMNKVMAEFGTTS